MRLWVRVLSVLVLATAALSTGGAVPAWSQLSVNPQSLVGEWHGDWQWSRGRGENGKYYLTIQKVEGDKVYGRVEFTGPTFRPPYDVEGRLSGNVLTFSSLDKQVSAELKITDDMMTGSSVRFGVAGSFDISVKKKR